MAGPYTTISAVQGILGDDYGPNAQGVLPDLQQHIDTADVFITTMVAKAKAKGVVHSAIELEMIERWLAAHCYCQSDPTYQSRSTAGASGQFTGQTGQGFESTRYGQQALRLDRSYCLRNIDKQQTAGAVWLGQTDPPDWPDGWSGTPY